MHAGICILRECSVGGPDGIERSCLRQTFETCSSQNPRVGGCACHRPRTAASDRRGSAWRRGCATLGPRSGQGFHIAMASYGVRFAGGATALDSAACDGDSGSNSNSAPTISDRLRGTERTSTILAGAKVSSSLLLIVPSSSSDFRRSRNLAPPTPLARSRLGEKTKQPKAGGIGCRSC